MFEWRELRFVFQGEVNVTNDSLNDFLAVAEDLQVRPLVPKKNTFP